MSDLPLNPKKEIWKWGPIPFRLYYGDWFDGIFRDFPEVYPGHHWPEHGFALSKGRRFVFLFELEELVRVGGALFLQEMLPLERREWTRGKWKEARDTIRAKEAELEKLDLSRLSIEEFKKVWKEFRAKINTFWLYSNLPELANYGSIEILKEKLRAFVPPEEMDSVLETLTAPLGLSFYQEEEIDLAETNDLEAHQKKYFWLKNSYAHVEVCPVEFFEERKRALSGNVREEMTSRLFEARARKEEARKTYGLSQEVMDIADAVSEAIVWQDVRKGEIWIYLHTADRLVAEVARRFGYEKDDLLDLFTYEIEDLMDGKQPTVSFADRKGVYGVELLKDDFSIIDSKTAGRYWDAYVESKDAEGLREFKGVIASKGKVTGKVRIVLDAHQSFEFDEGDILVAPMTSPEYVFVMKKAAAIVTDAGGLTSHAAIVSRELGVPCIVGTKVATQALKDGDRIEVDANTGIVRRL